MERNENNVIVYFKDEWWNVYMKFRYVVVFDKI